MKKAMVRNCRSVFEEITRILDQLEALSSLDDVKQMGSGIHKLSGDLEQFWFIKISPNFRIIFRFQDGDVYDVDYIDYH
ncbi:MAG: type II toxin-antitoxin system RelE/ParE family toxin [Dyadobacter sp.]|uniref:type II toxin-antitoxin system RelE/ParE family toxin n=1 Tax=Dyadobacter sp. TaxID=1914288 RepID=UPI00326665E9